MFRGLILALTVFLYSFNCFAVVDADLSSPVSDENSIAIYGTACEKTRQSESKSSTRVRVTDKASFVAVSEVPELIELKKKLNDHDFNVMVYNIVDDMLEDMSVRTTKQDLEEICVELTGFLRKDMLLSNITQTLTTSSDNKTAFASEALSDTPAASEEPDIDRALVYIAPTEFYNNTKSEKYAEILKYLFDRNLYFNLTDQATKADYVITSKVLRAKVDPINANTNRLQMVVSVELQGGATKTSVTEHQNKFVLFSEGEDEQKVAYDLMKKLFKKAGEPLLTKVENLERKRIGDNDFITPAKSGN